MYVPPAFRIEDLPAVHAAMGAVRLASLVTVGPDGLMATHLPLLLEPGEGELGTLYGHVARANPQWRGAGTRALAIFQGPDAYVTPSWYATKRETREGGADLELRRGARLGPGRVLRRSRAAAGGGRRG